MKVRNSIFRQRIYMLYITICYKTFHWLLVKGSLYNAGLCVTHQLCKL